MRHSSGRKIGRFFPPPHLPRRTPGIVGRRRLWWVVDSKNGSNRIRPSTRPSIRFASRRSPAGTRASDASTKAIGQFSSTQWSFDRCKCFVRKNGFSGKHPFYPSRFERTCNFANFILLEAGEADCDRSFTRSFRRIYSARNPFRNENRELARATSSPPFRRRLARSENRRSPRSAAFAKRTRKTPSEYPPMGSFSEWNRRICKS